jgi:hypothetical protein
LSPPSFGLVFGFALSPPSFSFFGISPLAAAWEAEAYTRPLFSSP